MTFILRVKIKAENNPDPRQGLSAATRQTYPMFLQLSFCLLKHKVYPFVLHVINQATMGN